MIELTAAATKNFCWRHSRCQRGPPGVGCEVPRAGAARWGGASKSRVLRSLASPPSAGKGCTRRYSSLHLQLVFIFTVRRNKTQTRGAEGRVTRVRGVHRMRLPAPLEQGEPSALGNVPGHSVGEFSIGGL